MPEPDTTVYGGRYELHRRLARGGMADVHLARDALLDRPVAIKVLFPEFATDPAFVERFRREAQSAANLNHPNVVGVYDWGEEDRTYYIVMELIEGRSLAQILRDEGPLAPERAAEVTIDVAGALAFAHRNGVIHRDVKPGNVMISTLGQVKVADFGIARAVSTQENLTQTGAVMGTATYFSPEQAKGEPVDPRSDLYSLGVVLYELLVGEPPFKGESPVTVAYKHVSEPVPPPRSHDPRIPAALEAIAMRALAKIPANRYASCTELAEDLRRFLDGRPVQAESVPAVDDATRAVAPVAGSATRAVPVADATRAQPVDDAWVYAEPPRRSRAFVAVLAVVIAALLAGLAFAALQLTGDGTDLVDVPDVTGRPQEEAVTLLRARGFEVRPEQDADSGAEEGTVVGQDPAATEQAEEGSTVTIVVASAKPPVEVPKLVGQRQAAAEAKIRELELTPAVEMVADDAESGTVIRQDPAAGTKLPKGSSVRLTVSRGPEQAEVPNVVGKTCVQAQKLLFDEGLFGACDPDTAVVARQSPAAGTKVEKGSSVDLTATAPPTTTSTTTTGVTLLPPTSTSTTPSSSTTTVTTSPS